MKLAIIKLGARISYGGNDTSGGAGEARSVIKMLKLGGADCHVYTKMLPKDKNPSSISFHQIEESFSNVNLEDYDALVVINGAVNFFGGVEDPAQILNYWMINNFKGKVFYIYCDPNLSLKQIWPSISKKEWANNWKQNDIEITRNDIIVISQVHNMSKVKDIHKKAGIDIKEAFHYPLYKFPMLNPRIREPLIEPVWDISYGGTFRTGKREKKLIDFYFGYPDYVKVNIFGKIKLDDFKEEKIKGLKAPIFTGPVAYDQMIPRMSESKCHIVIGDLKYPDFEMISQRAYESIQAGCVTFIDSDFDRKKRIFGTNKELSDFLYVKNRKEMLNRLDTIIDYEEARRTICDLQIETVGFEWKQYCTDFVELIKENI